MEKWHPLGSITGPWYYRGSSCWIARAVLFASAIRQCTTTHFKDAHISGIRGLKWLTWKELLSWANTPLGASVWVAFAFFVILMAWWITNATFAPLCPRLEWNSTVYVLAHNVCLIIHSSWLCSHCQAKIDVIRGTELPALLVLRLCLLFLAMLHAKPGLRCVSPLSGPKANHRSHLMGVEAGTRLQNPLPPSTTERLKRQNEVTGIEWSGQM